MSEKLSDKLRETHNSGDYGQYLEKYIFQAIDLEAEITRLKDANNELVEGIEACLKIVEDCESKPRAYRFQVIKHAIGKLIAKAKELT